MLPLPPAVVPLLMLYYAVRAFYRSTSRELQRIESMSRSPVYAAFSQIVEGHAVLEDQPLQLCQRAHWRDGLTVDGERVADVERGEQGGARRTCPRARRTRRRGPTTPCPGSAREDPVEPERDRFLGFVALELAAARKEAIPPYFSMDGPWCQHWKIRYVNKFYIFSKNRKKI